ncbi:hypothetical protein QYE76_040965 [Lolium multiflorum]|uniref:Uncharacterized protein n=1 Tax=Lolium multiflorum TaxID=4521 RepID=A0AAD8WT91_LOLMU|nr:hypothetical protein QYE76_040965 [Lolium multiflorum]
MGSPRSNPGGSCSKKKGVVSYYLDSVVAPLKTLNSKEGVLLLEEVKAPKIQGTLEERLQTLEDTTSSWRKRFEPYEARIKDLEEKYVHTVSQLDKFQALMWDVENQNCAYEYLFKKIAEVASTKYIDLPLSFYNGRPYPWKLEEWEAHYEDNDAKEEDPAPTTQAWGNST